MQYLITRIYFAFFFNATGSDTGNYFNTAQSFSNAVKTDSSFYQVHSDVVEYPPLAVIWMSLPSFLSADETFREWNFIYKLRYFLFDLILISFLVYFYIKPGKYLKVDTAGLFVFIISGVFLFNFMYERLDFWLGGLIFYSILFLFFRKYWLVSFVLLAIAINFKIIPVLLIPIVVIGSIDVNDIAESIKKTIFKLLSRCFVLVLLIVAFFYPFYLWGGEHTLDFIQYHSLRGLQLESFYSSLVMVFSLFGLDTRVFHAYGAYNIESGIADIFILLSSYIVSLVIVIIAAYYFINSLAAIKKTSTNNTFNTNSENAAQYKPQFFLRMLIVTLMLSISFSKVFSPQYIFWVVPLFALIEFKRKQIIWSAVFFVLACALTTPIFPYLYFTDFVQGIVFNTDGSYYWQSPTILATIILFARNLFFLASAITLLLADGSFNKQQSGLLTI